MLSLSLIHIFLGLTIVALVFGVMKFGWYFAEISALFMGMSLIVGMIMHKGKFEDWALDFIEGAKEMAGTAILMGMSRMILVIATEGQIMDTIIYAPVSYTHLPNRLGMPIAPRLRQDRIMQKPLQRRGRRCV